MDNLDVFAATVSRGLWVQKPGDILPAGSKSNSRRYTVSDIDGKAVAHGSDYDTAVLKAFGKVARSVVASQKENKTCMKSK